MIVLAFLGGVVVGMVGLVIIVAIDGRRIDREMTARDEDGLTVEERQRLLEWANQKTARKGTGLREAN